MSLQSPLPGLSTRRAPTTSSSKTATPSHSSAFAGLLARPWLLVGLMTLFGAALRFYNLGYKSLWVDEAILYWIAQGTPREVLHSNAALNSAPPTYALVLNVWQNIGPSEAALRSLSYVGGVLGIPAAYWLCSMLLPRAGALFATFLVMVSNTQLKYSQELREYSWTFTLACLMLALFLRVNRRPSAGMWALMILAWCAGVLTQYGLAILIAGMNLVYLAHCWRTRKEDSRARETMPLAMWLGAQAFVILAVVLVFKLSLQQQMKPGSFGATGGLNYLAKAYWDKNPASLVPWAIQRSAGLLDFACSSARLLFPLVGLAALWIYGRKRESVFAPVRAKNGVLQTDESELENARWTAWLFGAPLALGLLLGIAGKYPYHGERQDMYLIPMVYVVAGWGFVLLARLDWSRLSLPVALVLGGVAGAGAFGVLERAPEYHDTISFWWLPVLLVIGVGASLLARAKLPRFGLLLAGVVALSGFKGYWREVSTPATEQLGPVMRTLHAKRRAGDRTFASWGTRPAYSYYYRLLEGRDDPALTVGLDPLRPDGQKHGTSDGPVSGAMTGVGRQKYEAQLDAMLRKPGRVWLVFSHDRPGELEIVIQRARAVRPNRVFLVAKADAKQAAQLWLVS